jgi:hypothetical protein
MEETHGRGDPLGMRPEKRKPRGEQGDQGEAEAPAPADTDATKIKPDDAEEEEGTTGKTGESDAGVTEHAPHFRAGHEETEKDDDRKEGI